MSYYVNVRGARWGLIFREMKDGVKKSRRVKQTDLLQYGLRPDMSAEEAKARAKQLNAETRYQRHDERTKLRALGQANLERGLESKHFPRLLVDEFERTRLKTKFEFAGDNPQAKYKKAISRWRYARRMVLDLDLKVEDWADEPRVFYRYFIERAMSLDYVGKVLGVLNMWGHFIAKKQGRAFLPIPAPRGHDRQAIADAYNDSEKKKKESLPLTPEHLESVKSKLKEPYYNWLLVSVWFGLRPHEVGGKWRVEHTPRGKVLAVYQTKLTTITKDKRWKRIPVKLPGQARALAVLEAGTIKRPPTSAIRLLGEGYGLYGGRKGFAKLMKRHGEVDFMAVVKWLGHLDPKTTIRHYDDLNDTDWGSPVKKVA